MKPRPSDDPNVTFVYIIQCGDLVKIGVSNHPENRLKSLRTGMPLPPHLVATRELPTRKQAQSLELRLHRLFHKQRSNGEWFRVPANIAAKAMRKVHFHRDGEDGQAIIRKVFLQLMNEPELF